MKRRIASSLLALCMLLSLLPTVALAGESAAQTTPATEVRTAQELETAISGGGAVRLMADIDLTGSLFITTDVTLDLNGKVLRGDGSGSVIRIETAVRLVLEDSSPETVHKFDTSQALWALAAEDATGENITEVKGGVITGGKSQYGGGIYVTDKTGTSLASLTMNGGNIVGCAANGSVSNGGGVYAHYSLFRMTGGSIRGCTTNEKSNLSQIAGAGVYMSGGGNAGFTMTGGTISDCKAGSTTGGDAVCIASRSTPFNVTDGVVRGSISNNGELTGGTFEGAVYNATWGNIIAGTFNGPVLNSGGTISGGIFNAPVTNDSGTVAGGTFNGGLTGAEIIGLGTAEAPYQIFSEQDLATVQSKISDSSTLSARLMGDITGNLIVQGSVTLDLNGKVFKSADSSKSVIIATLRSSLTILDSDPEAVHKFDASQALWTLAAEDAAGAHIREVKGGIITGGSNPTGNGGGVTLATGCTLLMQGGSIVGCRADQGGGINSAKDCSITLSGKAGILGCTARYGGGIWLTETPLTLSDSAQITGCTAEELGGGIYVRTGPLTMEGGSISECQAVDAASGQTRSSGIYLDSTATMYAESGQVDSAVENKGTIGRSSTSGFGATFTQPVTSTGTIGGGVFKAQVDSTLASITGGVFRGKVVSSGSTITGGEFAGEVYSQEASGPSGTVPGTIGKDDGSGPYFPEGSSLYINSGAIKGGNFEGSVQVSAPGAALEDGSFGGTVKMEAGSISGGAFLGKTEIDIAADSTAVVTIHDGIFYGDVDMNTRGRPTQAVINGGTYLGSVTGDGTINDSAKVTVRFDTAGGTAVDSQRILRGQKIQEPQTTRSGYTLNGWYDRYQPWHFSWDAVREDMTLRAGWTVAQQFTLQPGETYWFDLSAMGIPGTVNADAQAGGSSLGLPDATMHYVPFTYVGTTGAYVLNSAAGGKSNASDLASAETEKSGLYGYSYPHSLFIAQYNVTHSVSWDDLNKAGFIFGKDYSSGGVHYTLRAPSVGSHDDYNYSGRYAEPENNEWNSIFNDSTQDYDDNSGGWIKNWAGQYSWGQDTFRYSTDGTQRVVRGLRTADTIVIVPMSAGSQGTDAAQYGYRPVLEVLNAGVLGKDGLKVVTLALNGGSIGGQQEIRMVVKNGAAFTAPGGSGLTAPEGLAAESLYWLGSNGKSYSPGASVPAEVTALTAQWATGHSHCICGGTAYDGHTDCTDVTWLPWAADDSLPTTGGHYYLLQDVTLTAEQEITGSLHLCLSGKTIRYGGSSGETPITVGSSGELSVYDCAGTGRMEASVSVRGALTAVGGRIAGGASVQVQPDAALTLTGRAGNDGTITVSAGADFLMEGSAENSGTIQFVQPTGQGRVFRGQADSSGGTVELRQPAQGAGLQISGQAKLGDITCADPGLVLNVEETAAICGVMDVGESSVLGTVTCSGEIRSGIFRGDVVNNGRITGGIFYGTVTGSGTIEESAKVTLSFRTDGSPAPAEQRILRGQKAAAPEKPEKNGYIFGGWYLGGALYDFDAPVLTETQLEAGWTVRSGYSVLFDTNGGSAAADRTGLRWTDKVLSGVDEPTRSGWQFRFWQCGDVTVTEDTTYADLAGKDSVTEITLTARWKDAEKPTGAITIGQSTWQTFQETLTYTQFFSGRQTVTIDASDNSGRVQVGYYVTTEDLTPAQLTGLVMRGYEGSFTLQEDGRYIVYALLVDDALNITCLRSDGITLDSTPPVISGITEGEVFCGPVTVTVREENLQEVRVDNVPVSLGENGQFVLPAKADTQTVTAYDRAGNTAEVTVTVNAGHTGGEATCKDRAVCSVCGESYGELNGDKHVGGSEIRGSKSASCTEDGYTGDTFCLGCGTLLSEGKAIPATGHSGGEATCKDKAVCSVCGESYGELNGDNHVGGSEVRGSKNASCTEDGYTGGTFCLGCGTLLSEGKAIPATGHSGGEATCKDRAVCSICGESYGELDGSKHLHLRHIAAKEATSAEVGNPEYWYCDDCRRCFADEAGLREMDRRDTVIAKLPEEPETGDRGNPALWLGLLAASGIAAGAALLKKRRDSSAG